MTRFQMFAVISALLPALSFAAPSKKVAAPKPAPTPSKYFVVQNIATEKTRVYERCVTGPDCAHRMVFETETVVGRPEEGTAQDRYAFITWVGHSKIASWVKFYTDKAQTYPSWYSPGQDINTIPGPIGSGSKLLGAKKWTVKTASGGSTMYGAFGWYAAMLLPQDDVNGVNFQWMHGTIGWGSDEQNAIELTRGTIINLFSNPGSHGCTRLENRSIAYLRSLLAPGTDIYRVYARESTREQEIVRGAFSKKVTPLPSYAEQFNNPGIWNYILLTDEAQKINGLEADADVVRASGIPIVKGVNFLEEGSFRYDRYPNAVPADYNYSASSGKTGDRYLVDSGNSGDISNFKGFFLVDEGRFVDYQHPSGAAVGGKVHISGMLDFRDSVPEFLKTSGDHQPAEITYRRVGSGQ
ncbi:MAG: hypothetical protein H7326_00705 [Bdellovibrionaceae bacterium]|nr:hypothetical protein [Pseudobdellovibrionaceae bacterium]